MRATARIEWVLFPVLAVLAWCTVPATAWAGALHVELVTVGPGSDDLERYGHSALCLTPDGEPDGRCYDFGVPGGDGGEKQLVWDTLRGKPRFVPISVERSRLVATFEDMERSLWVQDLPLDDRQAAELQTSLEASVRAHQPYAYHPYYDNCTTRLRDAIDKVTSGKLHDGADAPASGPGFRVLSEQGFSGRLLELAGLAMFLGTRADRQPTAWEAMFLPVGLRDAVAARLGVQPKQIYERREAVVRSSAQAGRFGLILLGALLAGAIRYGGRKNARWPHAAMAAAGIVLGLLGLTVDGVWLVSNIPEFGRNWVALVLVPTDALLAFAAPRLWPRYLGARLGMLALLATLSATGIIAQPLVAVAVFAALPIAASYFVLRRSATAKRATPTARGTTAPSTSAGAGR